VIRFIISPPTADKYAKIIAARLRYGTTRLWLGLRRGRRRGLRYATEFWVPDNDIPGSSLRYERQKTGIFAEFMKYAGKFLRKLLTEDYVSCIMFAVFV
jgi:hypothetical protein